MLEDQDILQMVRTSDAGLVGQQHVRWIPDSWNRAILDEGLDATLVELVNSIKQYSTHEGELTRTDVVRSYERGDLEGYLATIAWGCGNSARNRARMLKVFSRNEHALDRIQRLVMQLKQASPAEAWDAIRVTHRLKWLGPAFGTKVAYFAALSAGRSLTSPLPLIADARVQAALDAPVTSDRAAYAEYCQQAARITRQLESPLRRVDQVEYVLFTNGGRG